MLLGVWTCSHSRILIIETIHTTCRRASKFIFCFVVSRYLLSSTNPINSSLNVKTERPSSSYPGDRSLFSINTLSTSLPNIVNEDFGRQQSFDYFDHSHDATSETPLISVKITTANRSTMHEDFMDETQVTITVSWRKQIPLWNSFLVLYVLKNKWLSASPTGNCRKNCAEECIFVHIVVHFEWQFNKNSLLQGYFFWRPGEPRTFN